MYLEESMTNLTQTFVEKGLYQKRSVRDRGDAVSICEVKIR